MHTKSHPLGIAPANTLKLILILLVSASLLLLDVDDTHACVCSPTSPSDDFDGALTVFSGKAIAKRDLYRPISSRELSSSMGLMYLITLNDNHPSHKQFIYEFQVDTIYKGSNFHYMYIVTSLICGRGFTLGERYLVYAGPGMTTGQCDGSHMIGSDIAPEVLETLGEGQPPRAGTWQPRPLRGWYSADEMVEIVFEALYSVLYDLERESRVPPPAPGWLIPTAAGVAGVAGVVVGALATTLLLRRRGGGI